MKSTFSPIFTLRGFSYIIFSQILAAMVLKLNLYCMQITFCSTQTKCKQIILIISQKFSFYKYHTMNTVFLFAYS